MSACTPAPPQLSEPAIVNTQRYLMLLSFAEVPLLAYLKRRYGIETASHTITTVEAIPAAALPASGSMGIISASQS